MRHKLFLSLAVLAGAESVHADETHPIQPVGFASLMSCADQPAGSEKPIAPCVQPATPCELPIEKCDKVEVHTEKFGSGHSRRSGLHQEGAFWYLNAEVTALSAIGSTSAPNYLLDDFAAPATVTPFASNIASDQLTASPRLTFGKSYCSGWGFQTSYWDFNATSGNAFSGPLVGPAAVPDLNIVNGHAQTRAYTFDIEGTKRFSVCETMYLGTLGVRHGSIENSSSSMAFGQSVLNDVYTLSSGTESGFHGTGLTYSLLGIRPIANKCFSLYGGARFSNLFGQNSATAQTSAVLASPAGGSFSNNGAINQDDDALFIAQLQTGVMWTRCLKEQGGRMFARAGFEYQYWDTTDLAATSTSFAGAAGSSQGSVTANAGDLQTQFVGFALGAGYSW
jgi:hypothetical protein